MILLINILTALILLVWLGPLAEAWLFARRMPKLTAIAPDPPAGGWPRVSIVLAACNEAATVEPAMRTLLALDYPEFEIIAVDDRSTDATGVILDALSTADPRLRVIHNDALPEGWLGKNHALARGAERATGGWLLFTDADVLMEPTTLRRAIAHAEDRNADHLTLGIEAIADGWLERGFAAFFICLFVTRFRPWRVADPRSRAHLGVGAFNLVRAAPYRAAGGHAALRMDVLDDVKLGKLMKRKTGRAACLDAGGLVRVRWVEGPLGLVRGLEKNAFAGFGFNPVLAIGGAVFVIAMGGWPWLALALGGWPARLMALATLAAMAAATLAYGSDPRVRWHHALAFPLAGAVMAWTILRSTALTLARGGVRWRGTFYPLRELRRGRF